MRSHRSQSRKSGRVRSVTFHIKFERLKTCRMHQYIVSTYIHIYYVYTDGRLKGLGRMTNPKFGGGAVSGGGWQEDSGSFRGAGSFYSGLWRSVHVCCAYTGVCLIVGLCFSHTRYVFCTDKAFYSKPRKTHT